MIFQHGRKKQRFSFQQNDRELFTNMVLDDTWDDAEFFFLYRSSKVVVPDSWHGCIEKFASDLLEAVGAEPDVVRQYNEELQKARS